LLFTTLQMGLLGALLTFAPEPVFAPHLFTTEAWGLSSLEDQQLGGAIMWIVGSGIYLVAALVICSKLFYRKARVPTC
jgi:putative membrane protein